MWESKRDSNRNHNWVFVTYFSSLRNPLKGLPYCSSCVATNVWIVAKHFVVQQNDRLYSQPNHHQHPIVVLSILDNSLQRPTWSVDVVHYARVGRRQRIWGALCTRATEFAKTWSSVPRLGRRLSTKRPTDQTADRPVPCLVEISQVDIQRAMKRVGDRDIVYSRAIHSLGPPRAGHRVCAMNRSSIEERKWPNGTTFLPQSGSLLFITTSIHDYA